MRRAVPIALLVVILITTAVSLGLLSFSPGISATVVDIDEGTPLADAVVVVRWDLVDAFHGGATKSFRVEESVTDESGEFFFSWWLPRLSATLWPPSVRDPYGPQLFVHRNGYLPGRIRNLARQLDGDLIRLKRASEIPSHADAVDFFVDTLQVSRDRCIWERIPRMTDQIRRVAYEFDSSETAQQVFSLERFLSISSCETAGD